MWTFHVRGLTPLTSSMPVFLLPRSIDEMRRLEEMSTMFQSSGVDRHPPEPKPQPEGSEDSGARAQPWEMVMEKKHFKLWRRPIAGTPLYQYRGEPGMAACQCVHGFPGSLCSDCSVLVVLRQMPCFCGLCSLSQIA